METNNYYYRVVQDVYGTSIFVDEIFSTIKEAVEYARDLMKKSVGKPKEVRVSEWREGNGLGLTIWYRIKLGRKFFEEFRQGYELKYERRLMA